MLIVSGEPSRRLTGDAREHLSRIPSIVLSSRRQSPDSGPTVVFRTSPFGINTAGTVFRMDGVPCRLRAVLPSSLPER